MRTITYKLADLGKAVIHLGKANENEATRVQIDAGVLFAEYPTAVPTLKVINPAGTVYSAEVTRDGDYVLWDIKDSDLTENGSGEFQLTFTENGVVVKSAISRTQICPSITGGGTAPDPVQDWLDHAEEVLEEVEDAFPEGGTTGQVLAKKSDADFDTEWVDQGAGGTTDYTDLENKPQIGGVTLTGNVSLHDIGAAAEADIPDPTSIIDDTAGSGDTDKTWSADKLTSDVLSIIQQSPETKETLAGTVDLDVTDADGNVILRLSNGGVKTKEFNSATASDTKSTTEQGIDLDFTDESGNVVMRLENGYIKTKKFDSTDPFELPSYYSAYLDEKCERIRELMKTSNGGDAFFFITDQHMAINAHQSFKMIKYIADKCRINKLFSGGDMLNGGSEEYADEYRKAMGGSVYILCGNHEYLSAGKDTNLAYWYTSSFDNEIGNPDRRYFYVDDPKHKIRYICLNSYAEATPPSTDASAGYEQDQLDWLSGEAMDVESDWLLIVFAHAFWAVPDMTEPVITISSSRKAVLDQIDTTATANNLDVVVIQGHTHLDAIKATDEGIPVIITTCDKWGKATGTGYEPWLDNRVPGTITEQAFDVCVVDKQTKKITAVRVGAFNTGDDEEDEELTEAGERVINYARE